MSSADSPATRLATRLLFLVAGFGYACWAPLVPITKHRLGIDEHVLGLLILCMGIGSIAAMLLTGMLTARLGSRPVLIGSALGLAAAVLVLPVAGSIAGLALALALFGAMLGALDVAMNLQAVEVERAAGQPLMSGFHALFSVGGFAGSAFMTLLLSSGAAALTGTAVCAAVMACAMVFVIPRLLPGGGARDGPLFALPRGRVLVIALLAAVTFLVEGSLLDWSALLITDNGLASVAYGGLGYMVFSVAMTCGRFTGDAVSKCLGDHATLLWGGAVGVLGFVLLLLATSMGVALCAFVLIGLGCANIVPVLFRCAAAQQSMPSALAVAAVTTTGYAGILAGPAVIGFVAKGTDLHVAFWMLAGLLVLVPVCAGAVSPQRR